MYVYTYIFFFLSPWKAKYFLYFELEVKHSPVSHTHVQSVCVCGMCTCEQVCTPMCRCVEMEEDVACLIHLKQGLTEPGAD